MPRAPAGVYKPSMEDIAQSDPDGKIIEFPNTVIKIGMNLPVTGGFYFRTLPLCYQTEVIKSINKKHPVLFYLHPWETYPLTPVPKEMPWWPRFITYHAKEKSLKRFETLLKAFEFSRLNPYSKRSRFIKYARSQIRNIYEPWIKIRLIVSFSGMGKISDTISMGTCRSRKRKVRRSNCYGI